MRMLMLFFIIIIIGLLGGYFIQNYIRISQDVYLFTFSAIIQAYVALIALLGMVIIFELQIKYKDLYKDVEGLHKMIWNIKAYLPIKHYDIKMLIEMGNNILKELAGEKGSHRYNDLAQLINMVEDSSDDINRLINHSIPPMLPVVIVIAFSSVCIMFSDYFSQYKIGLPVLFGIVLASIFALIKAVLYVVNRFKSFREYQT